MKTLIRLSIVSLQADLSLRWAHMPIRWFCHDAAQIRPELFLEMTQWKNFMSAWVQVLDFTKSLVYSNCQNDRFFFPRLCAMYAFYHICLFIISGEFDALRQLSVKKDFLEIQHPKLENSRRCFIVPVHER